MTWARRMLRIVPRRIRMRTQADDHAHWARLLTNPPDDGKVTEAVAEVLASNFLLSMATVRNGGGSYVHTAFFATAEEGRLFFLSDPATQHAQNVDLNPSAAVSIFDSHQVWGNPLAGLQLFGTCQRAQGKAEETARARYGTRFPAFFAWYSGLSEAERREFPSKFYEFQATTVKVFHERLLGEETFVVARIERDGS